MFFHFGVPGFEGGFVGVDIFYVISGFLIGGILWREFSDTGSLRLGRFYLRRFRRLAPAFFTMAFVSTAVAWVILLPFEFREYGKTLIAATVYLSNVLFYRSAGYFDTASEEKVLLHTWSLSVEEQFYIFLPLAILALARWPRLLAAMLAVIALVSLAASALLTEAYPQAAFFLFPFRMWEMLAGVLLAIWGARQRADWYGHPWLSFAGLGLIAASILMISPGTVFPGVAALLPVAGTLLLLANGGNASAVNIVLKAPVPVFFGLISYSLYLWHWPVLTLSTYLRGSYVSGLENAAWMVLALVLATASWLLIERPVRRARRIPGPVLVAGTALGSLSCLALGGYLYLNDGLRDRFGPAAQPHITASQDFLQDWSRCHVPRHGPLMGIEVCPIGPDGDPELLVWGDSHVRAFKEGLDRAAHEADRPGLIIWRAGCPPLFHVRKIESAATPSQDLACTQANLQIGQAFRTMPTLQDIVLIGRWTYYMSGKGVGLDAHNSILIRPSDESILEERPQSEIVSEAIATTIHQLGQDFDRVAVLRQPPEIALYDSRIAAREFAHRGLPLAGAPRTQGYVEMDDLLPRASLAEAPFRALEQVGRIVWLDTWMPICSGGTCHALVNGEGYYFDNNHLTNTAALRMRSVFHPLLPPKGGAGAPVEEARLR